ncbi:MAG TPA: hypothetical protein VFF73_14230 [Planctomycetota bacterium]|nr:hypothetical protein [Planctomycetota bacterium]
MKRRIALAVLAVALVARADDAKKLVFETPKDWKELPAQSGFMAPTSSWEVAKEEGDSEAPQVLYYDLGGQGGDVDSNVDRWVGQFTTKDGEKIAKDKVKRETFESNGLKITTIEVAGTFKPRKGDPKKGWKLVAAYVDGQGKGGPFFVKLLGPEKSVDKAKDAFVKWLKSAKLEEKK